MTNVRREASVIKRTISIMLPSEAKFTVGPRVVTKWLLMGTLRSLPSRFNVARGRSSFKHFRDVRQWFMGQVVVVPNDRLVLLLVGVSRLIRLLYNRFQGFSQCRRSVTT